MRRTIAYALALLGFYPACAESERQRAEHAIVVATYERELQHCIEVGKASGSYAVYEACARAVDRRLCTTRGLRCVDAGAP